MKNILKYLLLFITLDIGTTFACDLFSEDVTTEKDVYAFFAKLDSGKINSILFIPLKEQTRNPTIEKIYLLDDKITISLIKDFKLKSRFLEPIPQEAKCFTVVSLMEKLPSIKHAFMIFIYNSETYIYYNGAKFKLDAKTNEKISVILKAK